MMRISTLAGSVKPSATLAAGAKARELRASGVTVYDLSLGEPDFNTPDHVCQAAIDAMRSGQTHYTPAAGTAEVRKAVADWYKRTYDLDCTPQQVIVSNGAKHSIHNVLAALVGPGDDVIIPTPYWVSYSDLVSMTGANPVLVETTLEEHFKLTPEKLDDAITPSTRMLMLNSPNNPTGAVYTREELTALVDVAVSRELAVLSDEIYELLTYDDAVPTCVATLKSNWRDQIITVSGASKSYAMTGWRLGWTVAPAHVVKAMDAIQSQETSCPSSLSQAAVVAALTSPESKASLATMLAEFDARRHLTFDRLSQIPRLNFDRAQGAFYAFFEVRGYFNRTYGDVRVTDSESFCAACLAQAHVNLVPGIAFGAEGFARMSFATDRATLTTALDRFADWLATGR